jgi:hypothetical protein
MALAAWDEIAMIGGKFFPFSNGFFICDATDGG